MCVDDPERPGDGGLRLSRGLASGLVLVGSVATQRGDSVGDAMTYEEFLKTKSQRFAGDGFDCNVSAMPSFMFEWQKKIVRWACKKGRAALWADTGLGKTVMQLAWADQVVRHTGKQVLILTPLAVSYQTESEAQRFGLKAQVIENPTADGPMIHITNYQKLHRFDASVYGGVVLDESSILKSFMGKTKQQLCNVWARTTYRLACTATPAPNDHLELGNHSAFLGIMNANEMISRWFMNDAMEAGNYRLKGHAKADFWRWVASWALVLRSPADLGYDSTGYDLPKLHLHHVTIPTDGIRVGGMLFADASLSATTLHDVLRQTAPIRAKRAAEIVDSLPANDWLIWTHTNYEADELTRVMPKDSIEVRGSDTTEHKESAALWMAGLTVERPSRIIGKCKKTTSRNITEKIGIEESPSLSNGSNAIEIDGRNTCASTSSATERESMNSGEPLRARETREDESSILTMSLSGLDTASMPKNGRRKILKSDSPNDSLHMELHQKSTGEYSLGKKGDAQSAGFQNAVIIPSALKAASVGFMSITATKQEPLEGCSVQTAISDSESSETPFCSSSELSHISRRRILISKSEIFGYGMNFQSCHSMIFVGMDYSYEKFYQAVRRCWRYGQKKEVNAWLLCTDMEWRLFDSLAKKQAAHVRMQDEMIAMMNTEYTELMKEVTSC